jgi:ABC-type microcin C transport system permease subunit YejB
VTYFVRRLLVMVPVLVLVSIIAFSLAFLLPGDPAEAILGDSSAGDTVAYEALRAELGLDRPVPSNIGAGPAERSRAISASPRATSNPSARPSPPGWHQLCN